MNLRSCQHYNGKLRQTKLPASLSTVRWTPFNHYLKSSILVNNKFLMSKEEIKYEINKVLDQFSDTALKELLAFLKQLEEKSSVYDLRSETLNNILREDEELLKKLAQ